MGWEDCEVKQGHDFYITWINLCLPARGTGHVVRYWMTGQFLSLDLCGSYKCLLYNYFFILYLFYVVYVSVLHFKMKIKKKYVRIVINFEDRV